MSVKFKKVFKIVLITILVLLVIFNLLCTALIAYTMDDISRNFYSYYPFLQPSGYYYDIDDVKYIAKEWVLISEDDAYRENDVHLYSPQEIGEIFQAAREEAEAEKQTAENDQ